MEITEKLEKVLTDQEIKAKLVKQESFLEGLKSGKYMMCIIMRHLSFSYIHLSMFSMGILCVVLVGRSFLNTLILKEILMA